MIENVKSYNNWTQVVSSLAESDDIFLHVIQSNDDDHPVVSNPIVLFIRLFDEEKTFTFSFDHQDSTCPVSLHDVCNFLNSVKVRKWVIDRKSFTTILPSLNNINDVNLLLFMKTNKLIDCREFETSAHTFIKRNFNATEPNKIIPLMKHLEFFNELFQSSKRVVKKYYKLVDKSEFNMINYNITDLLRNLEFNGICVDPELFHNKFGATIYNNSLVYCQYNIFTATGRPSCRFGGVNYAALNKDDGSRKCFISRFGSNGELFLVDYSAFHPHLICDIIGYNLPSNKNVYEYLGELYFKRNNLSDYDISESKKITFRQLYGGVEEKYKHIKYFVKLNEYVSSKWEEFNRNGYVLTPVLKRRIDSNHLVDANPNKLFNYILQSSELESIFHVIVDINNYTRTKLSKPILYTYDSLLFDIYTPESGDVIPYIINTMSMNGKMPVKSYIGDNYDDMNLV
jgi:hypothetical protein